MSSATAHGANAAQRADALQRLMDRLRADHPDVPAPDVLASVHIDDFESADARVLYRTALLSCSGAFAMCAAALTTRHQVYASATVRTEFVLKWQAHRRAELEAAQREAVSATDRGAIALYHQTAVQAQEALPVRRIAQALAIIRAAATDMPADAADLAAALADVSDVKGFARGDVAAPYVGDPVYLDVAALLHVLTGGRVA